MAGENEDSGVVVVAAVGADSAPVNGAVAGVAGVDNSVVAGSDDAAIDEDVLASSAAVASDIDAGSGGSDDDFIVMTDEVTESGPGIYPQDDGTIKVVLFKPLKTASQDFEVVTVTRMPTVKEMDKAGGRMAIMHLYDSAHMSLMPAVTEPSITASTWGKMHGADTTNLMGAVVHFLTAYQSGAS